MTREEVKNLLSILQAFAEGKTIQVKSGNGIWYDGGNKLKFDLDPQYYRIKLESKYRPFKDTEECWEEMQKHQPFGWLMHNGYRYQITSMTANFGVFCDNGCDNLTLTGYLNDGWTFADGTPFGMKEDGTKTE